MKIDKKRKKIIRISSRWAAPATNQRVKRHHVAWSDKNSIPTFKLSLSLILVVHSRPHSPKNSEISPQLPPQNPFSRSSVPPIGPKARPLLASFPAGGPQVQSCHCWMQ